MAVIATELAPQDPAQSFILTKSRLPRDVILREHQGIHQELEDWALWNREKYEPHVCDSIEGQFDAGAGGRIAKRPAIALPEDPRHRELDQVVRYMRMWRPQHGECLVAYYVDRRQPTVICRLLHLRWEWFAGFMATCRAGALGLVCRIRSGES